MNFFSGLKSALGKIRTQMGPDGFEPDFNQISPCQGTNLVKIWLKNDRPPPRPTPFRVFLNLWFAKPMISCGSPEITKTTKTTKTTQTATNKELSAGFAGYHGNHERDENHGNAGCKPRVPQTTGLEIPDNLPGADNMCGQKFYAKIALCFFRFSVHYKCRIPPVSFSLPSCRSSSVIFLSIFQREISWEIWREFCGISWAHNKQAQTFQKKNFGAFFVRKLTMLTWFFSYSPTPRLIAHHHLDGGDRALVLRRSLRNDNKYLDNKICTFRVLLS